MSAQLSQLSHLSEGVCFKYGGLLNKRFPFLRVIKHTKCSTLVEGVKLVNGINYFFKDYINSNSIVTVIPEPKEVKIDVNFLNPIVAKEKECKDSKYQYKIPVHKFFTVSEFARLNNITYTKARFYIHNSNKFVKVPVGKRTKYILNYIEK